MSFFTDHVNVTDHEILTDNTKPKLLSLTAQHALYAKPLHLSSHADTVEKNVVHVNLYHDFRSVVCCCVNNSDVS